MTSPRLLSIQTGRIQTHTLPNGEPWTTAYVKTPIKGPVALNTLGLDGDEQQHKRFHGGEHRALLLYPAEHYPRWRQELGRSLPYGSFGENLAVTGIGDESTVCIGDVYQIGEDVRVQVSQPRQPCDQIYMHLQIRGIRQRVDESHRTGWYARVLTPGILETGQSLVLLERPYPLWTINRAQEVKDQRKTRREEALELAAIPALEPGWQSRLKR
jgi:MOSC domain-containing protein YiiM